MDFLIAESTSYNLIRTRWLFGGACLAMLAVGVLTLRWLMARSAAAGRGGLAGALQSWWDEEIWLGGPFAAGTRERMAQGWFTAVSVLFMLRWLLGDLLVRPFSLRLLTDLVFWGIAIKLLFFTRCSAKQLLTAGAISLVFLLCSAAGSSQLLLYQILLLLCVKDIDLRRAFRDLFAVIACVTAAVMLLAALGLIPTFVAVDPVRTRRTFGFYHFNACGKYLFYLAGGWLMLRFGRVRWWDWLGLAALLLLCVYGVDSRAPSLGILTLLAAGLFARFLPKLWRAKPLRLLGAASPWAATAASFVLAFSYRAGAPLWDRLNILSSGRLDLYQMAVERLAITPFGQMVKDEELYTLDNMYLNNFYALGVIGFLLYFCLLTWLILQCWKKGWAAETAVLLGLVVYGVFESFCWESACPAILLFANMLYPCPAGWRCRISRDAPPAGSLPQNRKA